MDNSTQNDILLHLQKHGSITPLDALWEYLKRTDQIATVIKHSPDKITAEIVDREEKEF